MRNSLRWLLAFCLLSSAAPAAAQTLSWDPSTVAGVVGYSVSYGPRPGFYTNTIDVGNQLSLSLTSVDKTIDLFFAVRAYTSSGYTPYSSEVELPASVAPAATTIFSQLQTSLAYPLQPGQTVTWTAYATSSAGAVEYEFWMYSQYNGWTKVRDYSQTSSFTWTWPLSDPGTHLLEVWARTVGSSSTYEAWMSSGLFDISPASTVGRPAAPQGVHLILGGGA